MAHLELGPVGAAAARRLFLRFFPDEPDSADAFQRALGQGRFTPADLQGWLLAHADDLATACKATGLKPVAVADGKTLMAAE